VRLLASSSLRRAAVIVGVVALGVGALTTTAGASIDGKKTVIDTFPQWDGTTYVYSFGCPNTTTYGEVVTAPAHRKHIRNFTYTWHDYTTGSMVVRGEVYAWNGTMATGPAVAESAPQTITSGAPDWFNVTFKVKGRVQPGQQYVIFASIDKDFEQCTDNYSVQWGLDPGDAYAGGYFVYLNSGGDESQWTTQPWSSFDPQDLAFKATFTKK
jgi:hypothetical protein